jgi:hypothetical protein
MLSGLGILLELPLPVLRHVCWWFLWWQLHELEGPLPWAWGKEICGSDCNRLLLLGAVAAGLLSAWISTGDSRSRMCPWLRFVPRLLLAPSNLVAVELV